MSDESGTPRKVSVRLQWPGWWVVRLGSDVRAMLDGADTKGVAEAIVEAVFMAFAEVGEVDWDA